MSTAIDASAHAVPEPVESHSTTGTDRSRAFSWVQVVQALPGALRKLNPAALWRNPVMFLVWVGAALTTAIAVAEPFLGGPGDSAGTPVPLGFTASIAPEQGIPEFASAPLRA